MEKGQIFSVVGKWNLRSCLLPAKLAFLAKLVQIGVKLCEFWIFISNKCAILFILSLKQFFSRSLQHNIYSPLGYQDAYERQLSHQNKD